MLLLEIAIFPDIGPPTLHQPLYDRDFCCFTSSNSASTSSFLFRVAMSKDAIDSVKPKKSKKSKHADANADVVTAANDVDAKVEKKKRKREAETEAATTVTTGTPLV